MDKNIKDYANRTDVFSILFSDWIRNHIICVPSIM